jgi:aspartate--ammonia ligase
MDCIIPQNYNSIIDARDTEKAIGWIKDFFQDNLAKELNLLRISFVQNSSGTGEPNIIQKPISYALNKENSVTTRGPFVKWKRMALVKYEFSYGEGLYTYLNEVCPDQDLDNLHSIYVDQLDWERIISTEELSLEFLKQIVHQIYAVIKKSEDHVHQNFPFIKPILPDHIQFVHTEEIEHKYPASSPLEQKDLICKEYGTVFLMKGNHPECYNDDNHCLTPSLNNHPDLNGDLLVWYPLLNRSFKILSIGIREDSDVPQMEADLKMEKKKMPIHDKLPPSIGGEIGQSRLCMFFLRKAHIGEVQSSIWPEDIVKKCNENNVFLL